MSAFGSGQDLRVLGSSPTSASLLSGMPASPSAMPPACVPSSLCVFFCQIHKQKLKEENSEIIHSCLGQSVSSCGKQVPAVSVAGISGALLVPQNLTLENVSKLDIAYDL